MALTKHINSYFGSIKCKSIAQDFSRISSFLPSLARTGRDLNQKWATVALQIFLKYNSKAVKEEKAAGGCTLTHGEPQLPHPIYKRDRPEYTLHISSHLNTFIAIPSIF